MSDSSVTHFSLVFGFSALALFIGILLCQEVGRWVAIREARQAGGEMPAGVGAVDGAAFALLGLLLAFTYSGAANRFEHRREQIVEEANDIGTAWLRLDLLPADSQA